MSVGEEGKVLLILKNGKFFALGHKCTHYGAPLVKGCIGDGRIRCPWHGACFNIETGDIEEFPGLDSLAQYDVKVVGEEVTVKAKKEVHHHTCIHNLIYFVCHKWGNFLVNPFFNFHHAIFISG